MSQNNYPNQYQNQYTYYVQPPVNNSNVNRPSLSVNYNAPNLVNNGFSSPQATNHGIFNNFQANVQTSISPNPKTNTFGTSKLSNMGRFIKD